MGRGLLAPACVRDLISRANGREIGFAGSMEELPVRVRAALSVQPRELHARTDQAFTLVVQGRSDLEEKKKVCTPGV
jgi:hypothetical protein